MRSRGRPAVGAHVRPGASPRARCRHLVELGPGDRHVTEVVGEVGLVEDLLGQEVLVVLVQIVACLDLGGEFAVESAVHHPPGDTLRHHERHSVLVAEAKGPCMTAARRALTRENVWTGGRLRSQVIEDEQQNPDTHAAHPQATRGTHHKHFSLRGGIIYGIFAFPILILLY